MNRHLITHRGFTLTELMVGLGLSSVIALGVAQLFVANSQTYQMLNAQTQIQETGRFALGYLVRSAQISGYKGCFSRNDEIYKTFIPAVPYEFDLTRRLIGYEGDSTGWTPDIEVVLPKTVAGVDTNVYVAGITGTGNGINTNSILRGTDIFTVNHISPPGHQLAANLPTSAEPVTTTTVDFDFGTDYLAYIHDCEKASIFRVTNIAVDDSIEHDATVDPDGFTNALVRLAEFNSYETDAFVSAIESHTYFLAPGISANSNGQLPMSLWRKTGVTAPVEIVEGIEDLQLTYGVDTDNDGVPNRYLDADSVLDFDDVLTLRITLVANSINAVGGTSAPTHGCLGSGGRQFCVAGESYDGLIRRAFTRTVSLKNRG